MKGKLLMCALGAFAGMVIGVWIGKFYWGLHWGRLAKASVRLVQEVALAKDGKRAFSVYLGI